MKYLHFVLVLSLILVGCKSCDLISQQTPQKQLRLLFDDIYNVSDSLAYYEVQKFHGADTLGVKTYSAFNNVLPVKGQVSYIDTIQVNTLWFKYRVRVVHKNLVELTDWTYTRYYKYTEFFPVVIENIRIVK